MSSFGDMKNLINETEVLYVYFRQIAIFFYCLCFQKN